MEIAASLLHYPETRAAAVFFTVLFAGLLIAGGAFLLRPWPPQRRRVGAFALLAAACLAGLTYARFTRDVRIDASLREVIERRGSFGIGPVRRVSFDHYVAVAVEQASADGVYAMSLRGAGHTLPLREFADVRQAEDQARALAEIGGWQALRRGYRVQSSLADPGVGLAAGSLQRFTTPAGRSGVSVSLQDLLRVVPAAGEESPITP